MSGLDNVSRYVYGTTRLGDAKIAFEDRVKIARAAMDAGVWFHTSHQYGNALEVLRAAFDQDRRLVPRLMYKIGWSNMAELRGQIRQQLDALALEQMDLGQLCLGGQLAEEFRTGGPCYDEFRKLKDEGLVQRLVVEVFPWTSKGPLDALRGGWTAGVIDGFILYLNPLQRFASNELWAEIQRQNVPLIALRTVGGGNVHRLRDVPGAAWKDYLRQRAVEIAPIFERSGCRTWTEFCMRFEFGFPNVKATVGATSRSAGLREFLETVKHTPPLPVDIHRQIIALQHRWSDETDIHAEPWSM